MQMLIAPHSSVGAREGEEDEDEEEEEFLHRPSPPTSLEPRRK